MNKYLSAGILVNPKLWILILSITLVLFPALVAGGSIFFTGDFFPAYTIEALESLNGFLLFRQDIEIFFEIHIIDLLTLKLTSMFVDDAASKIIIQNIIYRAWSAVCWILLGKELGLRNKYVGLLVFCGMLSPSLNNANIYWTLSYFVPGFFYALAKIVNTKFNSKLALLFLALSMLGFAENFPNPKFVFYCFVVIVTIFVFFRLKTDNPAEIQSIKASSSPTLITFFFLAIYPLAFLSLFEYIQPLNLAPTGFGNSKSAPLLDHGLSTILASANGFHSNLSNNAGNIRAYQKVNFSGLAAFLLTLYFFRSQIISSFKRTCLLSIFTLSFIVFCFFSLGSNGPVGFFYEALTKKLFFLTFLRTTSGSHIFLTCISLCISLYLLSHYQIPKWGKFLIVLFLSINSILQLDLRGYDHNDPSAIGKEFPNDFRLIGNLLSSVEPGAVCSTMNSSYTYVSKNQLPSSALINLNPKGGGIFFSPANEIGRHCKYIVHLKTEGEFDDYPNSTEPLYVGESLSLSKLNNTPVFTDKDKVGLFRKNRYTATLCEATHYHCSFIELSRYRKLTEMFVLQPTRNPGEVRILIVILCDLISVIVLIALAYTIVQLNNKRKYEDTN